MSKAGVIDAKNKEADIQAYFAADWSRYTPKQLRTPINIKVRQKIPVSNSLQIAKEEYFKNRNILLAEEIQSKKWMKKIV
ncbi:hypothetical protein JTB14_013713 [Gonioctena quinquepunctata]|nr:hypothetical protein JTB14_013713 [Gonioctena quinquepunctata]